MAGLLGQVWEILEKERISHVVLLCVDALDGMLRFSQLLWLRWGEVESCMRYAEMDRWVSVLAARRRRGSARGRRHSKIRPLGSRKEFETRICHANDPCSIWTPPTPRRGSAGAWKTAIIRVLFSVANSWWSCQ